VEIVEISSGSVVSDKKFLWCGTELCEERDSTGTTVTKRFFGQGEQILGTNYFFTRDHLGSIREMTDTAGTIHTRYDYDPYGNRAKVFGDMDADFGFTGYYYHQNSGLCLTLFRAYDPNAGRWISRDPISESGGINLYAYVHNNPANRTDSIGLEEKATAWSQNLLTIPAQTDNPANMAWLDQGIGKFDLSPLFDPNSPNGQQALQSLIQSKTLGFLESGCSQYINNLESSLYQRDPNAWGWAAGGVLASGALQWAATGQLGISSMSGPSFSFGDGWTLNTTIGATMNFNNDTFTATEGIKASYTTTSWSAYISVTGTESVDFRGGNSAQAQISGGISVPLH
jgi:RHS repeat-associated protein